MCGKAESIKGALRYAEQGLREEVGALVADEECEDGKKATLRAGDFELADRASATCQPARR